jgi:prepilin-type processing-associated H-X9-DG protein
VLGRGTTRTLDRVAAAMGMLNGAPIEFERAEDVPDGGVLFALPALLQNGLLAHSREIFTMPEGYYPLESIFLLFALMTLARIGSLEALRYVAPGEWGKLLGLDRIPEVRTLRGKLSALCSEEGRAQRWNNSLAKDWMEAEPESAGVLYVDGHVRIYHGKLTELPRRYIARQRLCLRGTTDYWVNAMDGRPFFVVTQSVDSGLLSVLREQIVPRLKTDVPGQPSEQALAQNPLLSRFTVVFDREGYSPDFFAELKKQRIAVLTYHKFPGEDWPEQEFELSEVTLVHGEKVLMKLAERGVCLSNGLWVREVRRLSESGHQSSILSTDYCSDLTRVTPAMFARWCQENFFKYMRQHFGLDRLIEYGTQPLPDTTRVVNPQWRQLDSQLRSQRALLSRELCRFGDIQLPADLDPKQVEACERKKGELQHVIESRRLQIEQLKTQRKALQKHVPIKELSEDQRFSQLRLEKKHFIDTIKLIAYRAETAMAQIAREQMHRLEDARSLMRQLYRTEADLIPDQENKTLTVRLHPLTANVHDQAIRHLCDELNASDTLFPGTDMRLAYEIIGSS